MSAELVEADGGTFAYDMDGYRIAQLFHELAKLANPTVAADLVSRQYGITTEQVLRLAVRFEPEPLWRL